MNTTPPLQPTLWRTCRAIANRTRLQIFALLVQQPGQTVSDVATRLKLPLPMASESLRALEARGLLTARRTGRRVTYRPSEAGDVGLVPGLVAALKLALTRESQPVATVFRLATAFTHPRRIEILRALQTEPRSLSQIQAATDISTRALRRHLEKLETRGFVTCQRRLYTVAKRSDAFGHELTRLATDRG